METQNEAWVMELEMLSSIDAPQPAGQIVAKWYDIRGEVPVSQLLHVIAGLLERVMEEAEV